MPLLPAAPPNTAAKVFIDRKRGTLEVVYNDRTILRSSFSEVSDVETRVDSDAGKIVQTIVFHGKGVKVAGIAHLSEQSFASETQGSQQERFPLVRNSDGPSFNLRNNAIYDRTQDLVLIGPPDGATRIRPKGKGEFEFKCEGNEVNLQLKPHFYQKHKNIPFFEPWSHPLKTRPIMGWCSWWAYQGSIDELETMAATRAFAKNLKPYGYDIIQLDDGYESGKGAPPGFWLNTNEKFPSRLAGLAKLTKKEGMTPGIWVGTQIFDEPITKTHPDWFVRDADGVAHKGPWIGYGVDGSNRTGLDNLYGPVWDEFAKAGFAYVKIDSLRHLLYDSLYPSRAQMVAQGVQPEMAFRDYLGYAREKLGPNTYILACWGVLPEAVGLADGCRLGGDGFGPSTMQQYNSWNNVVWRNDPDHVDLKGEGDEILRPTLVSLAGAQLLLSDKAEFYSNPSHLEGAKRASPVPFTLPGQLYDFDSSKTDNLVKGLRNQHGGSDSGPIDADQQGNECPWWQLDLSRSFERWTVLGRLSSKAQPKSQVNFSDLGLPNSRYAVYEFWKRRYVGDFQGSFPAEAQDAKQAHVYCIREILDHPQILSTSRHITQGGPDLVSVGWDSDSNTLRGTSTLVEGDPYEVRIRTGGRIVLNASQLYEIKDGLVVLKWTSKQGGRSPWWIQFK